MTTLSPLYRFDPTTAHYSKHLPSESTTAFEAALVEALADLLNNLVQTNIFQELANTKAKKTGPTDIDIKLTPTGVFVFFPGDRVATRLDARTPSEASTLNTISVDAITAADMLYQRFQRTSRETPANSVDDFDTIRAPSHPSRHDSIDDTSEVDDDYFAPTTRGGGIPVGGNDPDSHSNITRTRRPELPRALRRDVPQSLAYSSSYPPHFHPERALPQHPTSIARRKHRSTSRGTERSTARVAQHPLQTVASAAPNAQRTAGRTVVPRSFALPVETALDSFRAFPSAPSISIRGRITPLATRTNATAYSTRPQGPSALGFMGGGRSLGLPPQLDTDPFHRLGRSEKRLAAP